MSFSIAAMITKSFTVAPPALQELVDTCGTWNGTESGVLMTVVVGAVPLDSFIALPVGIEGNPLPTEVASLELLHDKEVVILQLKVRDDERLYLEVVSGRALIAAHLPEGRTRFSVVRPARVIALQPDTVATLRASGVGLVPSGAGAGGGTAQGAAGQGTQGGTAGRKRNRGNNGDEDDEGEGDDDGLVQRDILGGKRECWVKSKTHERVKAMNPLFRLCTEEFRTRFCSERLYLVDGKEIFSVLQNEAGDITGVDANHPDFGFRNAPLLLSLEVAKGGYGEGSPFLTAMHGDWNPLDWRTISLLAFLPAEVPGENRRAMFQKGVRSVTGRGKIAEALRNHDIWWQMFSCEEWGSASKALVDSLLLDMRTWHRTDNVLILIVCMRALNKFYTDLRTQRTSATFIDTPASTGKECAGLWTMYAEKVLSGVTVEDERQGYSKLPHWELYDTELGTFPKIRHPFFSRKDPIKEEKEKEGKKAKEAKEAKAKEVAAAAAAGDSAAHRGGGGALFKPNSGAVCKAALCKLLGVKDGTGKVVECYRSICHFHHPASVAEVTKAEAQAAAKITFGDETTIAGMNAKTGDNSKGWKAA
jgi:hypothetical protein